MQGKFVHFRLLAYFPVQIFGTFRQPFLSLQKTKCHENNHFFYLFIVITAVCFLTKRNSIVSRCVDVKNLSVPHGSCVPNVTTDGNDIIIKSDSLLTDVTVVVKNQNGEVIHVSSETIDKVGATITVPNADVSEPATIDLYYDDKHLRGELAK